MTLSSTSPRRFRFVFALGCAFILGATVGTALLTKFFIIPTTVQYLQERRARIMRNEENAVLIEAKIYEASNGKKPYPSKKEVVELMGKPDRIVTADPKRPEFKYGPRPFLAGEQELWWITSDNEDRNDRRGREVGVRINPKGLATDFYSGVLVPDK